MVLAGVLEQFMRRRSMGEMIWEDFSKDVDCGHASLYPVGSKDEEEEETLLFKAGGAGCDPHWTAFRGVFRAM